VACPGCGSTTRPTARFCDQCGTRLPVPTPRNIVRPRRRRADSMTSGGDRRVVSALFADLVDYVRMLGEHDAEEVKRRVDAALGVMDEAVARFQGTREKFIGDAIFAVFGHPHAHDDDALRASLCAMSIRAALADLAADGEEPLAVRIGIATGEVVAAPRTIGRSREVSLTGPAIAIAARIQGLARPGEILIDKATLDATRGRLSAEPRGTHHLRGHHGPVRLFVLGVDRRVEAGAPATARLIGRHAERARLRALLDACQSTGAGQLAMVVGEAGMGKSRLIADLADDARAAGFGWTWTENVSHGTGEPYRFVRAVAQAIADEQRADSGSVARRLLFSDDLDPEHARRIAGGIAAVAREAQFSGWEAEAPLVPTEPTEANEAILQASLRYTQRLADVFGPRVLVIDDLHWADRSSLPVIDQLFRIAPSIPFVVLVGTRPGPLADMFAPRMTDRIDLAGLDPVHTARLAEDVVGAELATDAVRAVHERTAGNPLFVRETVRALRDDGSLVLRDGRYALDGRHRTAALPVTLRALLGARIDALPEVAREVLGVASVVGTTFPVGVIADLVGRQVRPVTFRHLVDAGLIAPVDGADGWRFAHTLVRDAAYAGLLASRRRELHARLADRLAEDPRVAIGVIARHRVAAGDLDRAIPQLDQAAREALAMGAAAEAAELWETAAELTTGSRRAAGFRRAAAEALRTSERTGGIAGQPTSTGALSGD